MTDPGWKKVERRIARYLGAERNPGSGGSRTATRSDSTHPRLFIETKHGKQAEIGWAAAEKLFEEVRKRAKAEGKDPVLVLHPPRIGGGVGNYPAYVDILGVVVQVPLRRIREGMALAATPFTPLPLVAGSF